jgi:beta-mannosidase
MLQTLSLNGTWKVRFCDGHRGRAEFAARDWTDATRYMDAQVPGEIHLDLLRAGLIPDPYAGTNVLAARWVEEQVWAYRKEFDAPADLVNPPPAISNPQPRIWLVFDQLDYAAVIYLNGAEIGRHHNVFYPCRIDVAGKLRPGRNILAVCVESGIVSETSERPSAPYLAPHDRLLPKRPWLRKPQCQFSWDWSPRFVNVGITRSVRLEWTHAPARLDQLVPLVELSDDLTRATVRIRQFVEGLTDAPIDATLTAQLVEAGKSATAAVTIKPALNAVEATLDVENPSLWWPVGHGPQNLHTLRVALSVNGKVVGSASARIGFRRVRVSQGPHPEKGRYFILEVNNRPVFCRGGNFVPPDMIYARIDRARYDQVTDLALEANFNFLRIWGGGMYEADEFYELCDQKGILVWQEFIFACAKYPADDPEFLADVKREATWNIRRLAPHPSLVVWCGNNEMEWGMWDWGWDKSALPDHALFHYVLPRLMSQEDPTRFYWPSSPFSPDYLPPNADWIGDQHPWAIGFSNTDFRGYRKMTCRFPNEGGTLGPTSLPTMRRCLEGSDQRPLNLAWQVHDNSIDSNAEPSWPNEMLKQHLGLDIASMSVEDYVYWGGLLQGEALREYIDNFRRRMFDSASAIFWMYNDTWPAARSWTIVDYLLRRTPSFHPVRRAMATVSVVVAEEAQKAVVVGINELARPVRADLRYGLFDLAGGFPVDEARSVELAPNRATPLASFDKALWKDPTHTLAFAMLSREDRLVARNRLILPLLKDMRWPRPDVKVELRDGQAIFRSAAFALGVCLDLDGGPEPADNFFDVWPGVPYAVPWSPKTEPKVLRVGNLPG